MSVVDLTKENFDEQIANHELVVLDFWAPWCGPCLSFSPVFEQVSTEYPDVLFAKINTEKEVELANDFSIRSIPTVMVLRQNVLLFSESGLLPSSALSDLVDQAKALNMADVFKSIKEDGTDGGA